MPVRPKRLMRPWVPIAKSGIANRERDSFYHTNAWRKSSERFLEDNPLCIACEKSGLLIPSKVTDHIIPKDICPDPWDKINWQPLCRQCHSKKSGKDKTHFK
ncbi:MAG: HNH endonuclease signature motif containing protein [Mariniphaga sp.]